MTAAVRSKSSRRPSAVPPGDDPSGPSDLDPPHTVVNDDVDGATEGEWLFKQDDLVLGPVAASVLVDRIKSGELNGDTPIARDGEAFRPMKLIRLFGDASRAAEDERRLAAEERAYQSAVARTRLMRVVLVVMLAAVPAAGAAVVARTVMIKRPWDDSATWIAAVPPMVDVPERPKDAPPPTPPVALAAANPDDAVDDDDDDDGGRDPSKPRKPRRPRKPPSKSDPKPDTGGASSASTGGGPDASDPDPPKGNIPETLTNAQAIAPLKSIQGSLKTCFKAEIDSNPDMPSQVVLSYTVTEEGRAANVSLDARELRGRPVVGCVQKAMGTLKWPRFSGERKNVSVPFKLGKPKSPR